nr:outer membrane beta-barrel protein [Tenacibaculum sp.]
VKSYATEIVNGDSKVSGYWTGDVTTDTKITYLSLPILAQYKLSKRWVINSGVFLSVKLNSKFQGKVSNGYLREGTPIGEKITFEGEQYATYDFSKNIHPINYGAQIGGQWKVTRTLRAMGKFACGLNNIFEKDFKTISFKMYPIYLSLGGAYVF